MLLDMLLHPLVAKKINPVKLMKKNSPVAKTDYQKHIYLFMFKAKNKIK